MLSTASPAINTTTINTNMTEFYYLNDTYSYYEEFDMEEYERARKIFQAAMAINYYYLWPIFAVGFPGNLFAIVTIFRMRSIGTFPVFVMMLAVMDSLAITFKLIIHQITRLQVNVGSAGCQILFFLGSFCSAYSTWILVFMAVERFLAVRFPLQMNGAGCTRKIVVCLLVIGLVVAALYLPLLWTYALEEAANGQLYCKPKDKYEHFMRNIFHWLAAAVYGFVPIVLLSVFNVLIARQIRVSLRMRSAMRNQQLMPLTHASYDTSIQRQVNLMLLSATVVFVIFSFPICLYQVADVHWKTNGGYTVNHATKYLCEQLAFLLCDSTHAVNFYLYFLTARRFRHHFLRVITCRMCLCLKTLFKRCGELRSSSGNNNNYSDPVDHML